MPSYHCTPADHASPEGIKATDLSCAPSNATTIKHNQQFIRDGLHHDRLFSCEPPAFAFPSAICAYALTGVVALFMTFYDTILRIAGHGWHSWNQLRSTAIIARTRPPPVPPHRRKPSKLRMHPDKKRLLLAGFSLLTNSTAHGCGLTLSSERTIRNDLRRHRGECGMLSAINMDPSTLSALQQTIKLDATSFHSVTSDYESIIHAVVDTGASNTATPDDNDFVPGTLTRLPQPAFMGGIAGDIKIEYEGIIKWETLDDDGRTIQFHTRAHWAPGLPTRLFSPHSFLSDSQRLHDFFKVCHDRTEWHIGGKKRCTIKYDTRTFLPRMVLFREGTAQSSLKAMAGCITAETNQNLSKFKRLWLRWHFKLGHLGFKPVRELGIGGFLDDAAAVLFRSIDPTMSVPKCATCQLSKQTKRPDGTTTTAKTNVGGLKRDQLKRGQLVFMDQLESTERGRLHHTAGREIDANQFRGSAVFADAATLCIGAHHQVTLSTNETIQSKTAFEKKALEENGVTIQNYHSDNGIFRSQGFLEELSKSNQRITFSGVGAKWQNGAAEGAIRIVASKARSLMIHSALHWPEAGDDQLWPLAVDYAILLYNGTPNPELGGLSPAELFNETKSDYSALRNAHVWGCPVYVLDPKLQDGHKLPKWRPRSRRAKFVGASDQHAESVAVALNLTTGHLSPQCHVVFDDWFETTCADEDATPESWAEMQMYQRYKVEFDPEVVPPRLADEWLTPEEIKDRPLSTDPEPKFGRTLAQESDTNPLSSPKEIPPGPREMPNHLRPWPNAPDPREPKADTPREPVTSPSTSNSTLPQPIPRELPSPAANVEPTRRSSRARKPIGRCVPEDGSTTVISSLAKRKRPVANFARAIAMLMCSAAATPMPHLHCANALGTDPFTNCVDSPHPCLMQDPTAMMSCAYKSKAYNPDLPSIEEALTGPHAEEFWKAMDKEIDSLEEMGTWVVMRRDQLPSNASVVPGTWAMRVKRRPDGTLAKYKARWCVRGDLMQQGLHYTDSACSPVVAWPTIRSVLVMTSSLGWHTRQVDFINAFCQADQKDPLHVELPQFYKVKGREQEDLVLCLQKSLCGQVNSPKLFFDHISEGLDKIGFKPSDSDPCSFINKELDVMVLQCVDDQIWVAKDDANIEKCVQELKDHGCLLTIEDDSNIFGFLGIDVEKNGKEIHLSQKGLTDKVIRHLGLEKTVSKESTPASSCPLGADKDGDPFDEEWSYPAAVGMLLYLSSNTRPDIQFAVHSAARFSHAPKKSHARAVKRIVRCLSATANGGKISRGIKFKPNLSSGLDMHVDADYAGLFGYEDDQDPVSVKSRTGFVLTLFGCPVLWSSKLQTDICLSSTAAEYVAFSMGMRELLPMRELIKEISNLLDLGTVKNSVVRSTVFEDNQGALSLVNVPRMSPRNKYLALKYHFFRSNIGEKKGIVAKHIRSSEQKADIFTEGLSGQTFANIRCLIMGW